jgi:putative membrane protein
MIDYRTKNWVGVLMRLNGTVIPRIFGRMFLVGAVSAAVCYVHYERGINLSIPATLHAMVGVALGLLLVFRTNASYDRYWEGRKIIGSMVANARDLARQSASYVSELSPENRQRIASYLIAYFSCVRHYLRDEREWPDLEGVLTDAELAELSTVRAPPMHIAKWLSDVFHEESQQDHLSEERLRLLDSSVSDLIDYWGAADRIVSTPIPFAYAHHIKGFLTIFCFTAPFSLLSTLWWYTPLASVTVAYALYGIDEIGVEIEEPFGYDYNDLPLDEIGEVLGVDIAEMLPVDEGHALRVPAAS